MSITDNEEKIDAVPTRTGLRARRRNGPGDGDPPTRKTPRVMSAVAIIATVAAIAIGVAWALVAGLNDDGDRLAQLQAEHTDTTKAEQVALDYAVATARVNYEDIDAWRTALKSGVSDQLKTRFDGAVTVVQPLFAQLRYVTTVKPLAAKVRSREGDQFVVDAFVEMTSKSTQSPSGTITTGSFTITLDKASGWTITDVGGTGTALPQGEKPAAPGRTQPTGQPAPTPSEGAGG
ncbi:hypothetical protein GOEFS_020_00210 [Gordonia effusa NBRC 100432]|uniref:Mce-associated membrane protein n=1 Tax=Gordonia effusa NBRC 100432 TaxID=1077974 RepID=H0QWF6_9ACTN|nr:hypothetical protein [Gordonia effusa]GAB17157.1 hypothetical protein GOEFS_020_00210 [Gordonia effusa NBRC 100432]